MSSARGLLVLLSSSSLARVIFALFLFGWKCIARDTIYIFLCICMYVCAPIPLVYRWWRCGIWWHKNLNHLFLLCHLFYFWPFTCITKNKESLSLGDTYVCVYIQLITLNFRFFFRLCPFLFHNFWTIWLCVIFLFFVIRCLLCLYIYLYFIGIERFSALPSWYLFLNNKSTIVVPFGCKIANDLEDLRECVLC